MKILAIPATNSRNGINRQLLSHVANTLDHEVELVDINDYEVSIYSPEREADGIPAPIKDLFEKIGGADAVIVSFAEYNGSYTPAWKNVFDWMSRIDAQVYQGKRVLMLAASPGQRAGAGVLGSATPTAPFFGAELVGHLGIGSFHENFDPEAGELNNPELAAQLGELLTALTA